MAHRLSCGAALAAVLLFAGGCGNSPSAAPSHHHKAHSTSSSGGYGSSSSYGYGSYGSSSSAAATGGGVLKGVTWLGGVDAAKRTVTIDLIAGDGGANNGFNFGGASNGSVTLTVPVDWDITVDLANHGQYPHSAVITASRTTIAPVFSGASTTDPTSGISPGRTAQFHFVAKAAGRYYIACGVPGHADQGMWIHFNVSAGTASPTVQASQK
ncbi:MAG: sulfocyanin-like copper-binding protein [Thermaerobacter sp.]|nr:sulfocyanin-like copper-binding protein [Thermaerobacter sp.]